MGWTGVSKSEVNSYPGLKEFFQHEFDPERKQMELLILSRKGSALYGAFELKSTKAIMGIVILTRTSGQEFMYKDMDETMGPNYYDCPEKILRMLTPTDNEYANSWRDKCWAKIHSPKLLKLKPGMIIQTTTPFNFPQRIGKHTLFLVVSTQPLRFETMDGDKVRIPRNQLNDVGYNLADEKKIPTKFDDPVLRRALLDSREPEDMAHALWSAKEDRRLSEFTTIADLEKWLYMFRKDIHDPKLFAQKVTNAILLLSK